MCPWWILPIAILISVAFGIWIGKHRRRNTVDGIIFWNEKGINMKLDISIRELALERDYVILQVIPNREIRDDIREMNDDSNRTIEGGQ